MTTSTKASSDGRPVFFFDLDNCLYSQTRGIAHLMGEKIHNYFVSSLSLSADDARKLHHRYYKDYGLALQGLIRHHQIDPMQYNAEVDDALPLEQCLENDPTLQAFLHSLDRTKVRPWILTNAYVNHAKRVMRILGIEDCFDGITYCDYTEGERLICKPYPAFYDRAMKAAGIEDKTQCYFVDDSLTNVAGAVQFGWKECVHFREPLEHAAGKPTLPKDIQYHTIRDIFELKELYPRFFTQ